MCSQVVFPAVPSDSEPVVVAEEEPLAVVDQAAGIRVADARFAKDQIGGMAPFSRCIRC